MKLSAIIFDLNGTILSDEDEYGIAFKKVLEGLGAKVQEKYPHQSGIGVEENWPRLLKKYRIKTKKTASELASVTQEEYLKLLKRVELREGFLDFIRDLKISGIPCALATSNSWSMTEKILDRFELEGFFDIVTTKEEVDKNKPDPEIFKITADKLQVVPSECIVFEDSQAGIDAAKNAGMIVVAVLRDSKYRKQLKNADFTILNFEDILSNEIFKNTQRLLRKVN